MKVVIVHSWSDKNRGDSGILIGMLNYLETTLKPTEISFFPIAHEGFEKSIYEVKKLEGTYPFLINNPYKPFGLYNENHSKIIKLVELVWSVLKFKLILLNPNVFFVLFDKRERKAYNSLREASVVISKGGHIFHVTSFVNNIRIIRDSFPILLAKKLNKKVVIASQSFGPFKTRYSKNKMRAIIKASNYVLCREQISIDKLKEIQSNGNIKFFPDFAFNMSSHFESQEDAAELSGAIGITVRQHTFKYSSEYEYLQSISNLIRFLISINEKVVIIPHCIGPTATENDIIISKKLYNKLSEQFDGSLFYFEKAESVNAQDLMKAYSELKLMIGTRFHSVIFALNCGVPAFAISYSGPKANIMDDFGMKEYMMDIESLYNQKEEFKEKISTMLHNIEPLRIQVKKCLVQQKAYFKESVFE